MFESCENMTMSVKKQQQQLQFEAKEVCLLHKYWQINQTKLGDENICNFF